MLKFFTCALRLYRNDALLAVSYTNFMYIYSSRLVLCLLIIRVTFWKLLKPLEEVIPASASFSVFDKAVVSLTCVFLLKSPISFCKSISFDSVASPIFLALFFQALPAPSAYPPEKLEPEEAPLLPLNLPKISVSTSSLAEAVEVPVRPELSPELELLPRLALPTLPPEAKLA